MEEDDRVILLTNSQDEIELQNANENSNGTANGGQPRSQSGRFI